MTRARPHHWPDRHDLPWDPVTGDIACERIPLWDGGPASRILSVCRYQWPQELWLFAGRGLGWGEVSAESANYALAILDHFLPARVYGPARFQGRWLACSALAVLLAPRCADELVSHIPYWGGTIPGAVVREWIEVEAPKWTQAGIDLGAPDHALGASDREERPC
jgi:hypothetical protein